MRLTNEEKRMLNGDLGNGVAYSMRLLTKLGEAMGADRMIKPVGSHIVSLGYQCYGPTAAFSKELDKEMLEGVKQFKIPTTTNPKFFNTKDYKLISKFGINRETVAEIAKTVNWSRKFEKLGAIPNYTCTPFFSHPVRMGEHIAGAESIAIIMYNSIYGARLNRETGPTALAAAITGRTPEFGMHLKKNRYAQIQINLGKNIDKEQLRRSDYSAIGYYAGRVAKDRNVVFTGIQPDISVGLLKTLLSPLGVSGAVMLSHVVGITPEAPTLEAALMGRKPEEVIEIRKRDIESINEMFTTSSDEKADIAIFGCPHAPLEEIQEISIMLEGKKLRKDAFLLIATAESIKRLSDRMGLTKIIEKSGGLITTDICPHYFYNPGFININLRHPIKTVATDCTKCAHLTTGLSGGKLKVKFGNAKSCINSVTK